MIYLFIQLYILYLDGNCLVPEKYTDHIKVKQFARTKSGQKANENRRNKMMSRVRLIPKIHIGYPASSFHNPIKEVLLIDYMIHSLRKIKATQYSRGMYPSLVLRHFFCGSIEKYMGRSILR